MTLISYYPCLCCKSFLVTMCGHFLWQCVVISCDNVWSFLVQANLFLFFLIVCLYLYRCWKPKRGDTCCTWMTIMYINTYNRLTTNYWKTYKKNQFTSNIPYYNHVLKSNLKGNSEEFHDSLYLHRTQLLLTMGFTGFKTIDWVKTFRKWL